MSRKEQPCVLVRLPPNVDDWIREQAQRSLSGKGSEILRIIRDKMDAEQAKKAG